MDRKRKKWLVVVITAIYIQFMVARTIYAFYTDGERVTNTIEMGNVRVDTYEEVDSLGKANVGVINIGKNPCYIRLYVGIPSAMDGSEIYTTLPSLYTMGETGEKQYVQSITTTITDREGTTHTYTWIKLGDYWYYEGILNVGETAILFNHIRFANIDKLPESYNSNIILYVEAVQSEYINIPDTFEDGITSSAQYAFTQLK